MPREHVPSVPGGYSLSTAREIKKALTDVRKKYGSITPANVVDFARPPSSPLHRFYDWDDSSAAEKYRLLQASAMIRRVMVFVEQDGQRVPARVYLNVVEGGTREYQPSVEVLSDTEKRAQIMAEMKQDVESMIRRYRLYDFCGNAIKVLEKAMALLETETSGKKKGQARAQEQPKAAVKIRRAARA